MIPKNNLPYRNKAKSSDVVCYAFLNTINISNELKRNISPISLMPFQKKKILEISNKKLRKISASFSKAHQKTSVNQMLLQQLFEVKTLDQHLLGL